MRLRATVAATAAFLLLVLSAAAVPPQETQDVAFSPNPVPIYQNCGPGDLRPTNLTITGTNWSGHHVKHDVGIYVYYVDNSARAFGTVDIPQGGDWQTTIQVDCGMPYLMNGQLILHVVLIVHEVNGNTGLLHYYVPVVWV